VKILDKRRKLVPCIAYPWQLELDELLEQQRKGGRPMRAIVLKARKLGFSTWISVKFLQRLTQIEYQAAIVCAQDTKTAGVIFDMAKIAHAHLPTEAELGLGFNIRPDMIGSSFSPNGRKFMQFGEPSKRMRQMGRTGESIFEIDTANAPEAGRGYTPSMLHLSEVARWEGDQASRKMLSLLNAVPYEPETIIVLESTANGLNHFHRRWISAKEGLDDPDTGETYVALFVPWHRDPGCSLPFATEDARQRFLEGIGDEARFGEIAAEEVQLQELYHLTPEQLYWRRMMIRTQHESSVELFKQENPASDEEAFIGSGRTVFSGMLIARAIKAAEESPAPVRGTLRATDWEDKRSRAGTTRLPVSVEWVPAGQMSPGELVLDVWEHPVKAQQGRPPANIMAPSLQSSPEVLERYARERAEADQDARAPTEDGAYVLGVDIAEGEANTFTTGDYHVLQVFDHRTHAQVALHESRCDIHLLPLWCLMVALYYNRAWLAVEVNGPGIAVVDPLHKDYHYNRMYRRKRIDSTREVEEKRPGWRTDPVTKPAMESTFGLALQSDTHGLRDPKTARQLSTYVITERGRHEALLGEYDDRLMAAMIAHRVIETQRPPRLGQRERRLRPSDPLTGYGAGYD